MIVASKLCFYPILIIIESEFFCFFGNRFFRLQNR